MTATPTEPTGDPDVSPGTPEPDERPDLPDPAFPDVLPDAEPDQDPSGGSIDADDSSEGAFDG